MICQLYKMGINFIFHVACNNSLKHLIWMTQELDRSITFWIVQVLPWFRQSYYMCLVPHFRDFYRVNTSVVHFPDPFHRCWAKILGLFFTHIASIPVAFLVLATLITAVISRLVIGVTKFSSSAAYLFPFQFCRPFVPVPLTSYSKQ
mgnify:CR=1 FL=1